MRFSEIEAILAEVTYKPGYKFSVTQANDHVHITLVSGEVPCAETGLTTHVQTGESAPLYFFENRERVFMILQKLTEDIERHEAREWLRHKGKHVTEPHPELPEWRRKRRDEQRRETWFKPQYLPSDYSFDVALGGTPYNRPWGTLKGYGI